MSLIAEAFLNTITLDNVFCHINPVRDAQALNAYLSQEN